MLCRERYWGNRTTRCERGRVNQWVSHSIFQMCVNCLIKCIACHGFENKYFSLNIMIVTNGFGIKCDCVVNEKWFNYVVEKGFIFGYWKLNEF